MKQSNAAAVRIEALDLEFPDWSGMERSSGRLGVDAAFELCEQYMLWFPKAHSNRRHQRREKCVVEFTL
jgi:hypothetical protein